MKLGDAFQDLVAAVQRAMDPGAEVKAGVWIEGPDGKLDMDVEVRGTLGGKPHFTLIECKDWMEAVGRPVVDAFDSKREDLKADAAIIFAKSGFTADAVRKARRKGIRLMVPMKDRDPLTRLVLHKEVTAKAPAVDSWSVTFYSAAGTELPETIDPLKVTYEGLPLANWVSKVSLEVLMQLKESSKVQLALQFRGEPEFSFDGHGFCIRGVLIQLNCVVKWLSQVVEERVSLGAYDVLRDRLTVPSGELWFQGMFKQDEWKETEPPPELELEPGSFSLSYTFPNPVAAIEGAGTPELDGIVEQKGAKIEPLEEPEGKT
jgi:hypothetical protein